MKTLVSISVLIVVGWAALNAQTILKPVDQPLDLAGVSAAAEWELPVGMRIRDIKSNGHDVWCLTADAAGKSAALIQLGVSRPRVIELGSGLFSSLTIDSGSHQAAALRHKRRGNIGPPELIIIDLSNGTNRLMVLPEAPQGRRTVLFVSGTLYHLDANGNVSVFAPSGLRPILKVKATRYPLIQVLDDHRFAIVTPETAEITTVDLQSKTSNTFVPSSPDISSALSKAQGYAKQLQSSAAAPKAAPGTTMVISGVAVTGTGSLLLKVSPYDYLTGMTVVECTVTGMVSKSFRLSIPRDEAGKPMVGMFFAGLGTDLYTGTSQYIMTYKIPGV